MMEHILLASFSLLVAVLLASASDLVTNTSSSSSHSKPSQAFCRHLAQSCPYLTSPIAWPILDEDEPDYIHVDIEFYPTSFRGINDWEQSFSMQATLQFFWQMPTCSHWLDDCPTAYARTKTARFTACGKPRSCFFKAESEIWRPNIEHINRIGDSNPFDSGDQYVGVTGDGLATWGVTGQFSSSCYLSFEKFPFDEQTCNITIGMRTAWERTIVILGKPEMRIVGSASPFSDAHVWISNSYSTGIYNERYPPLVYVSYTLKRKSGCYVGGIFIPMALLILLQVSIFAMPASLPDRSGLSMTSFLSSSVLLALIYSEIPKTASVIYLIVNFAAQTSLGVFVTIYTLVACRLARNRRQTFKKRIAVISTSWKMRLIDLIDLALFTLTLILYVAFNITYFAYAMN